jgi:pentatricopeptide repeat protein
MYKLRVDAGTEARARTLPLLGAWKLWHCTSTTPMPPRPFVNDGLWRCLCPGFPPNTAAIPSIARGRARLPQRNASRQDATAHCGRQLRTYSGSSAHFATNDTFFSQPGAPLNGFPTFAKKPHPLRSQNTPDKPALAQLPTYILYEHVRAAGAMGNFEEVMNICRVLIKDRGEQPNREMYTAILHSFVDSANGTAGKVRKVLEEMGFWNETDRSLAGQPKFELDARGCECVLEVLAVHPDYLLRAGILEYMKSRWFMPSDRARNFIIAGMLRERHFEHALELLEEMVRNKASVESWLFDKTIWMLLEFGEVEEAFYVLSLKEGAHSKSSGTGAVQLSIALWGALLDAAARRQLVSGTHHLSSQETP